MPLSTASTHPLDTQLSEARTAFATTFRRWSSQWSQPQLLKIAAAALGGLGHFHSSQIGGFSRGTITSPSPKALLATGIVNLSVALSNAPTRAERDALEARGGRHLPGAMDRLWRNRTAMLDADGTVMGPTELFEAFTGLRALPTTATPTITTATLPVAAPAIGRALRKSLVAHGIDWIDATPTLCEVSPLLVPLLHGETPDDPAALTAAIPTLADACHTTPDALWDAVDTALAATE